jgi:hypothetical protein
MKWIGLVLALLLVTPAHAKERLPRPKLRLVVSGAVLAGVFYVIPLALAIRYEEGELAVPLLGPLIDLRRCHDCTAGPIGQGEVAGLVLMSIFQAGGAAMLIAGLVKKRPPPVTVVPLFSTPGLAVGGRF